VKNRLADLRPWAFVVSFCLLSTQLAAAQDLAGSYELHGRRDDGTNIAVRLQVSQRRNGKLALERHVMLRGRPGSREVWSKWRSFQVEVEGERLRVVYTLPAFARRTGIVHRLRGRSRPVQRRQNTVVGLYSFSRTTGEVREVLENKTRLAPESGWSSSTAVGGKHTRLRLGETRRLPAGGVLDLVLACEGDLYLEGAKLTREDGQSLSPSSRAPGQPRGELRYRVQAGTYRVCGSVGGRVRALLVQAAQLAGAAKPWTTETWYPIHEFESDGTLNEDTLYREGGPLERFDRAFGLRGRQSAVAWERGEGDRFSDSFRSGHYHRRGVIREAQAEVDSGLDLDGDGRIGGDPLEIVRRLDKDRNGRVSQRELEQSVAARLPDALLRHYDFDRDGVVEIGSDVERDDARSYDLNRDGILSRDELVWILRGKGPLGRQAMALRASWRDALLAEVRRGQELSADRLRAGAHDFVDDEDLDRDGRESYEERNFVLRLRDGSVEVTNRYRRAGAHFLLERSRRVAVKDVVSIRRRADGDYRDSYNSEWWGHCNGVAIAGILFEEPTSSITFGGQTFSPDDLKGLLSEFALGQAGTHGFTWREGYRQRSLPNYTRGFHLTLRGLQPGRTSFMADVELKQPGRDGEVWNYALTGYHLVLREAPGDDPRVLEVAARIEHTGGKLGVEYRLHFSEAGKILASSDSKTTWSTEDESGSPRMLRYLLAVKPIQDPDRSANPFVSAERLRQLFGGRLPYRRAKPPKLAAR
jgi:Ca2+-binding EF-hand superfamily protein